MAYSGTQLKHGNLTKHFYFEGNVWSWNLIYSPFLSSASLLFLLRIQTAVLSFLVVLVGPMY